MPSRFFFLDRKCVVLDASACTRLFPQRHTSGRRTLQFAIEGNTIDFDSCGLCGNVMSVPNAEQGQKGHLGGVGNDTPLRQPLVVGSSWPKACDSPSKPTRRAGTGPCTCSAARASPHDHRPCPGYRPVGYVPDHPTHQASGRLLAVLPRSESRTTGGGSRVHMMVVCVRCMSAVRRQSRPENTHGPWYAPLSECSVTRATWSRQIGPLPAHGTREGRPPPTVQTTRRDGASPDPTTRPSQERGRLGLARPWDKSPSFVR